MNSTASVFNDEKRMANLRRQPKIDNGQFEDKIWRFNFARENKNNNFIGSVISVFLSLWVSY